MYTSHHCVEAFSQNKSAWALDLTRISKDQFHHHHHHHYSRCKMFGQPRHNLPVSTVGSGWQLPRTRGVNLIIRLSCWWTSYTPLANTQSPFHSSLSNSESMSSFSVVKIRIVGNNLSLHYKLMISISFHIKCNFRYFPKF